MAKTNSRNVRVFPDWFSKIDNKSAREHQALCEFLYNKIDPNTWEWSSDKTCFWVGEKSSYYKYVLDDGRWLAPRSATPREFYLPVLLDDITIDIAPESSTGFPSGNYSVKSTSSVNLGKINGSEAQRTYSGELDPHYAELARQELAANPIPEDNFDWDLVKEAMEE